MKTISRTLVFIMAIFPLLGQAQLDSCDTNVPYHFVDLSGDPTGSWVSPPHSRKGQCCGISSPDVCTSFEVILDSQAVALSFDIYSGAIPTGSMYYQIDCGSPTPISKILCVSGAGPHRITFCKPGNNQNEYIIKSIPQPIFPEDDTTRAGCSKPLEVLGLDDSTITWNSVYPGTNGDYNSFLSCTANCSANLFTPQPSPPSYIDYEVCGFPTADECGYVLRVCDTFRIYTLDSLSATVAPNPATFCQTGPGSGIMITASGSGGDGNYTYYWNDTSGTILDSGPTFYATSQQTYTLQVRDGLNNDGYCRSVFINVPVSETPIPVVDVGMNQMLCPTLPTVYLNGNVQNAAGGVWSGGNGTFSPDSTTLLASYEPTPAEVSTGSVMLVLTSTGAGGSCPEVSDTVLISYPDSIHIDLRDTSLLCNSSATRLNPVVTGGMGSYTYDWNTNSQDTAITVGEGNYCLTITDSMGCSTSKCINVSVPPELTLTTSSTDVSMNGGNDGTATANPSGGVPPYTYNWSTGSTSQTDTGLSYGIYTVTVSDSNGCIINGSIVVNEPRCAGFSTSASHTNVACYGDNNAIAVATPSGGTTPYTYLWDDPAAQTTDTAFNLPAGTYAVTINDSNSCLDVATVSITEPKELTNTISHTNVSTVGNNDGSASANPLGGTSPYAYNWSTNDTTQTITGLSAGVYQVTITDNRSCFLIDSVLINEPPCNEFDIYVSVDEVRCNNDSNGIAAVSMIRGTPPFDISWNTGDTTASISNLPAGNYTVEVTDSLGCYAFQTVTITEPSPLSSGINWTTISCNGSNDGTIDLSVSGGTFPYLYSWSNSITVQDQIYLGPGTYSVVVTDAEGCQTSDSVTLVEPDSVKVSHIAKNVTCFNGSDGEIDITPTGGSNPYTYFWSDSSTSQDVSSISAGIYRVTVTDVNGCVNSIPLSVTIEEPGPVRIDSIFVACPDPDSATANVTVWPSGGHGAPYQISFDNGSSYLQPGVYNADLATGATYYVMAKDSSGCLLEQPDTIVIAPNLSVNHITQSISCNGYNNGAIDITVSGGVAPYQYFWSNGDSTEDLDSIYAGVYMITVTDAQGCQITDSIMMTDPDSLLISYTKQDVTCYEGSDGSIDLTVTGGILPYSYLWTDSSTTQDISGITAGTYGVQVTDSNGCTNIKNINVTIQAPGPVVIDSMHVACPAPGTFFTQVTIMPNGGQGAPYQISFDNGTTYLPQGVYTTSLPTDSTYYIVIQDSSGCLLPVTDTLTIDPSLMISNSIQDVTCNGFANGSIDVTISGGVFPYQYTWSNGDTSEDLTGIEAGNYGVTVTDRKGCQNNATFIIQETDPVIIANDPTNITCYGDADGAIDLTVSGGTAPYNYQWTTGDKTKNITNLEPGSYIVTIQDINQCSKKDTVVITQPDSLTAHFESSVYSNGHNVTYHGSTNGRINLIVNGGTPPYTFRWSNGEKSKNIDQLAAGIYSVTITDNQGCTTVKTQTITEPLSLEMPTGFTPNGDGFNDYFVIRGLEAYPENSIQVFNRWGDLIFEETDYDNNWDGVNAKGIKVADGTYFVILTIKNKSIQLNGYVDIRK